MCSKNKRLDEYILLSITLKDFTLTNDECSICACGDACLINLVNVVVRDIDDCKAVRMVEGATLAAKNCLFRDNDVGVDLFGEGTSATLEDCLFYHNEDPLAVDDDARATLSGKRTRVHFNKCGVCDSFDNVDMTNIEEERATYMYDNNVETYDSHSVVSQFGVYFFGFFFEYLKISVLKEKTRAFF